MHTNPCKNNLDREIHNFISLRNLRLTPISSLLLRNCVQLDQYTTDHHWAFMWYFFGGFLYFFSCSCLKSTPYPLEHLHLFAFSFRKNLMEIYLIVCACRHLVVSTAIQLTGDLYVYLHLNIFLENMLNFWFEAVFFTWVGFVITERLSKYNYIDLSVHVKASSWLVSEL